MLTDQFKRSLKMLAALAALLLGGFLWLRHHIKDALTPPHVTLPANDKELITYNENRHIVTVTTPAGTTTAYSRNPSVEIRKDGTVKVDAHAYGLEFAPILGLGYQDTRRVYLGVNHFYFHQFDVFTTLGFPTSNHYILVEPMTGVSWNFYHNCALNVGVNPANIILHERPEIGMMLSVRL